MFFTGIDAVVMDIEGTTSAISFVHDVLFPYARQRIPAYVHAQADQLTSFFAEVAKEVGRDNLTAEECVQVLLGWMDEDKKITSLKTLQGILWADGYAQGDFKGHIFADVPVKLKKWSELGIALYIYSSGSIAAQKQIFGYSQSGDLTPYLRGYFDTTTGGKKEPTSYAKISQSIDLPAARILFLSDHPDELLAARSAGFATLGLMRPGNRLDFGSHAFVNSFDEIILEQEHDSRT